MKRFIVAGSVVFVTACSDMADIGYFAPRPVDGDADHVVLYAEKGIVPGRALHIANGYCAQFHKTAIFAHIGGDSSECVSAQLNYCATYECKK